MGRLLNAEQEARKEILELVKERLTPLGIVDVNIEDEVAEIKVHEKLVEEGVHVTRIRKVVDSA